MRFEGGRGYVGPDEDGGIGQRGNYHRPAALGVFLVPQLTASPQFARTMRKNPDRIERHMKPARIIGGGILEEPSKP